VRLGHERLFNVCRVNNAKAEMTSIPYEKPRRTASGSLIITSLASGAVYFALIFAFGFALGLSRDTILRAGALETSRIVAVLIEVPFMLLASWLVCARIVKRFAVPTATLDRVLMGTAALVLLLVAEFCVSIFLLDRSFTGHVRSYAEASYAIGLAAQLCFAAIPLIQRAIIRV
jgi:hypothetical protein